MDSDCRTMKSSEVICDLSEHAPRGRLMLRCQDARLGAMQGVLYDRRRDAANRDGVLSSTWPSILSSHRSHPDALLGGCPKSS